MVYYCMVYIKQHADCVVVFSFQRRPFQNQEAQPAAANEPAERPGNNNPVDPPPAAPAPGEQNRFVNIVT